MPTTMVVEAGLVMEAYMEEAGTQGVGTLGDQAIGGSAGVLRNMAGGISSCDL